MLWRLLWLYLLWSLPLPLTLPLLLLWRRLLLNLGGWFRISGSLPAFATGCTITASGSLSALNSRRGKITTPRPLAAVATRLAGISTPCSRTTVATLLATITATPPWSAISATLIWCSVLLSFALAFAICLVVVGGLLVAAGTSLGKLEAPVSRWFCKSDCGKRQGRRRQCKSGSKCVPGWSVQFESVHAVLVGIIAVVLTEFNICGCLMADLRQLPGLSANTHRGEFCRTARFGCGRHS